MSHLNCRHCGDKAEVAISFSISIPALKESAPLLHFHPACFVEIAGTEYLEEMFEIAKHQYEKTSKKK